MTAPPDLASRTRPGWRGRIGVIQPAPGVMLEHEWPRWLPAGMLFPVARIPMISATVEGYAAMAAAAPAAARDLASAGAGIVAYACTIGSLFAGASQEQALVERLGEASDRPAISLASSSVAALRRVGGTRLAIMTPYPVDTDRLVADYVAAQGFAVAGFVPTPVDIVTVGDLPSEEIAALAVEGLARLPDADALWIPCTAIQTLDAIAVIEGRTGRPVVSGSQSLLWGALRGLGVADAIPGAGRLLA